MPDARRRRQAPRGGSAGVSRPGVDEDQPIARVDRPKVAGDGCRRQVCRAAAAKLRAFVHVVLPRLRRALQPEADLGSAGDASG